MKRFLAVMLAAILVLCISLAAFAEDTNSNTNHPPQMGGEAPEGTPPEMPEGGFPGGPGGFPGGGFPGMGMGYNGGVVDMTALANFQAEQMGRELGLTEQQVKKIAKLNKKELDRRMNHMHSVGVPRMGGFPGDGPGGPGMGPGGFPGGGPGGFPGGEFPGMGQDQQTEVNPDSAESPELQQGRAALSRLEALEETKADIKARIKIEKKMKKILTEEQYARWAARRDGRHNFQLRPEAEFNLDNIPEEYREQFLERMRKGGYHEQPPTGKQEGQAPAVPHPFAPQM